MMKKLIIACKKVPYCQVSAVIPSASFASRKTTTSLDKSSLPKQRLISGIMMPFVNDVTIAPNAEPIMVATAKSRTLPLEMKVLNSAMSEILFLLSFSICFFMKQPL